MTILNWGSSVGNQTIDTSLGFDVPETEAERFARTGLALPANLVGTNDFGLGFLFTIDPSSGDGTFRVDRNGLKISSGRITLAPSLGDVILRAVGFPPGALGSGLYFNALDLTTIRMGVGDDVFSIIGDGINQSVRVEVNIDASQGYVFQSSIFAGAGDDKVSVLMPWQSIFKGGVNTTYFDAVFGTDPGGGIGVTLNDDLTLEEVPFGDLIVLKGSRFDWDIEFKDGNNDGFVTLESILDESDYIAVSNNNQISGFERILFGDILFDLVLFRQQESSAVFGQPDYYLNGLEDLAPELNSDIASGSELWEAFRFNRTKLQGITGTATDQTVVFTSNSNDTPFIVGALRFASLSTEAGNDIVEIGTAGEIAVVDASIDLGEGIDQLKVNGLLNRSSIFGGADADNIILTTITNSSVEGGTENDVVQVATSANQTRFDGGDGNDVLLLPGTFASYLLTSSDSGSAITLNDAFGNSITGFETIRFNDIILDPLQTISLVGPAVPVSEGTSASYTIALSGSALAAGESVAFALQLGNGTAQVSTDLAALVSGSLQAAAGFVLRNLSVDAGTGLIRAVATASRVFSDGSAIATLSLPVAADLQNEPSETFSITLTDFVQTQTVTTTIADVPPLTIRLNGSATVSEGQPASYAVVLDRVGLASGRSVTFSLDSSSGTATEGVDFAPLLAELLQAADGISLGGTTTAADGTVTVTVTNRSGSVLAVGAPLLTLQLPITTDSLVEGNETFGVTLASNTAVVSSGLITTTITDPPTVSVSVLPTSVVEESGIGLVFTFSLSNRSAFDTTVGYTLGGTAVNVVDYSRTPVDGTVTIGAGALTASITITPIPDATFEADETVTATITSASTNSVPLTAATAVATGTITDNDLPSIAVSVAPAIVTEDSISNLVFTFLLSNASAFNTIVAYALSGSASNGTDYTGSPPTGSVTIAAGDLSASITIDPAADPTFEGDETVIATITGALTNSVPLTVITTASATGTITENDLPSISVSVAPAIVSEDSSSNLVFTFSLSNASAFVTTVNYALSGLASNGTDYTGAPVTGSITIAAGALSASITIDPTADAIFEGDETVIATITGALTNSVPLTVGNATATGIITENDQPSVAVSVTPASVAEGSTTNMVYTFSLSNPSAFATTVNYTLGGSATNGTDYTGSLITGSVLIAAGDTSASLNISAVEDTFAEGDETLIATIDSATSNAITLEIMTPSATGTIRNVVPVSPNGGSVIAAAPDAGSVSLTGTSKGDLIIGNSEANQIYGGTGPDVMIGGLGADTFRFRLSDGLNQGDQIIDFNPAEDQIQLADVSRRSKLGKLFKGQAEISPKKAAKALAVVNSSRSAERSKRQLVYDRTSGAIYYNENGKKAGFGSGGLIATLPILIDFRASDITLLYSDQAF